MPTKLYQLFQYVKTNEVLDRERLLDGLAEVEEEASQEIYARNLVLQAFIDYMEKWYAVRGEVKVTPGMFDEERELVLVYERAKGLVS
jgi:hypothetical protein